MDVTDFYNGQCKLIRAMLSKHNVRLKLENRKNA